MTLSDNASIITLPNTTLQKLCPARQLHCERSWEVASVAKDGECREEQSMAGEEIVVDRDGFLWRRTWWGDWEPVRDTWGNHIREEGGGDGCFITTACLTARGLGDDCEQLETFRSFRDSYVRALPDGERIIEEYYRNAPRVVAAIEHSSDRRQTYQRLYEQEIGGVLELLCEGHEREAFERCMAAYERLKEGYLRD